MKIPLPLSNYFGIETFSNYPIIGIPQEFSDSRGKISNIADGVLGDVAFIKSYKNSVRANHFHHEDWHLSYLIDGEIKYFWEDDHKQNSIIIN